MSEINYKKVCSQVCSIAKKAGAFVAKEGKNLSPDKLEEKGRGNIVTYIDKAAEKMIIEALATIIPGAEFIAEEGTSAPIKKPKKSKKKVYPTEKLSYHWVIDPIDGTTNFAHNLPPFCVSIALMEEDYVVLGVVYEITRKECFYAWRGSKAYLNGKTICCSTVNSLEKSLIATGFSYNSVERINEYRLQQEYFIKYTHGGRRIGSAAADLVYVAMGRFDGFSQFNLSAWDVAAGAFIAQRAGAKVTDYSGGTDYIFGAEIVATNPLIFNKYLEAISDTLDTNSEFYPIG